MWLWEVEWMRLTDLDGAFHFFILCCKEAKREVKGPPQQPVPRWGMLMSLCSKWAVVEQEQSILQKQSPVLAHFHLLPELSMASSVSVFCCLSSSHISLSLLYWHLVLYLLKSFPPPPPPFVGYFFPSFLALPLHTSYIACIGTVLKLTIFLSVLSFQCFILAFHIFQ